ncbi:MAG: T9SS type A sorting domain-containing protein, partial [Ignavibacteriales bacterium]|nr:T9SS type A sorting domain-containing protein [Ignavibacteriales bacterium]
SGKDLASTDNNPFFLSEADLHIDTTQPSAVASFGASLPEVTDDIDGQARSVPNPEAGYDEFTGPVPGLHEVQPVDIINPPLSGLPQGLPFVGVSAKFKNNTTSSESYTARMRILDSSGTEVYNSTAAVTGHTGLTFMTVTWTDPFTPSIGALYTFIATSELGTDARPENDTVMSQRPAVPLIAGPVYKTTYETAAEQFGWFGTQDFEFGTPAKVILNAAHSGVNAWVTKLSGNYSEGGVDNQIYSPFFDFSSTTKGYVSWYHSMVTEPSWDGSIFEYSIDSGKTYKRLAPFVNDPDGVNWYSTSTYANAAGDTNCFDFGRSIIVGFLPPGVFGPKWTSNGVCSGADVATGPYGYVYIEHKLPPEVFGKTYVRFRYSFFSDGFGADEGVAFDDFSIDTVGAASNASISGMAWIDNNGNGIKDAGELPDVGRVILLSGSGTGRMVTDPGGLYSFTSLAPGVYTVEESTKTGWAVTTPPEKVYNISLSPGQTVSDADFGGFQGTIGGTVYNDITVNGAKDSGDPPLSNWRVRLLVGSTEVDNQLTNTSGDYQFSVGPGTYTIQEDVQDGWKQSAPPGFEYTDLHIDTVTGSSSIAGKDFGNYKLGRVQGVVFNDVNGNGIQNAPTDLGSIGFVVKLFKGSVLVDTALTSSTSFFTNFDIEKIDTGRYTLSQVPRSGYVQTAPSGGGSFSLTFDSSGQFFTKRLFGNFRLGSISGKVAIDINRNGILDPQDTIPLVSWRIRLVKDSVQVDSVLTSSSGGYAFSNLGPATYKVSIVTQSGWTQTLPAAQAPYTVTMSSGASVTNQNFGITLVTTAVGTGEELPKEFALHQNYPNPFNPVTMIKFDLPKTSTVGLSVYNVLGQQVAVLVANDRFMPGRYVEPFNGGNFPSGLYFYRIEAVAEDGEVFTQVLKMMLLK